MANVHTRYPYSGEACTSFAAYFQNIQNWLAGQRIVSGFAVTRASASSITIAAGTYMAGNPATTAYAGATITGITAAAATNHRYDIVYLDTADGTVKLAAGTPAVPTSGSAFLENLVPQPTDLPAETSIMIAVILVDSTGIPASAFGDYAVDGVADMRMKANIGAFLLSYLSVASQAIGDLAEFNGTNWVRFPTTTTGKYLKAAGVGADPVWDNLLISSLYDASQTQGDLIHRDAAAWARMVAGSANKYLMSNGPGSSLSYENLKIGSLTVASEARGDLVMRGSTTWGRLATGSAGQYLISGGAGADLSWGFDPKSVRFGAGSGDAVIATGAVAGSYVRAQADYTIIGYTLAETSATPIATTTVCDILKKSSYYPAITDSICASAKPTLTAATSVYSTTLTSWTTTISAGDWLGLEVESNDAGKCLDLVLYLQRR